MKRQTQTGSMHVVLIIVLVLAVLGALGFVFYQNFIAKKSHETTKTQEVVPDNQVTTELTRIAFKTGIYGFEHLSSWKVMTDQSSESQSIITFTNSDETVRARATVTDGGVGGACDTASPLKVRYYTVSSQAVTALSDAKAYMVEEMTDAEGGGYNYKIGLTQEGGETHAAVGDSHCTVAYVGFAARMVINNETSMITRPNIITRIEFPKLATNTNGSIKEMQPVKDMIATDDYKAAVKILESGRKE